MATLSSLNLLNLQLNLLARTSKLCRNNVISMKSNFLSQCYTTNAPSTVEESFQEYNEKQEQAKIQELRNVSRLSANKYRQYHGQPPVLQYKDLVRKKLLYAEYGAASGEDPRFLWPMRTALMDLQQAEQEGAPLMARLADLQKDKAEKEKAVMERRALVKKNMDQMPKWIADYHRKLRTAEAEASKKSEKMQLLLQEARDRFGYSVSKQDPKFRQMVEEKALAEKTEQKKRKKAEKEQKQVQRVQKLTPDKTSS